ncbi:uncharacterized protein LOC126771380 [Nymphalis io]|uniref:uncharacterized protein LOC126771380 n=1 Tax=Inachis io TaxID=171585 RepID=UPI00216981EC|nr:uncharacterized protein LOC126771380 [Nymphalis io]
MSRNVLYNVPSFLIIICFVDTSSSFLCYNCSSTHRSWNQCGGAFTKPPNTFNNSRHYLINCTGENSMCFVRSWAARAKRYWIVQRGCYQIGSDDPFPRAMITPMRAMTCKYERLPEAEYKVCFCNANWCNSAYLYKNPYKYKKNLLMSLLYILPLIL